MPIDEFLLEILACPLSKAPVVPHSDEAGEWLVSTDAATRRRYPVRDGLPIMLIDESETMDEAAWNAVMAASAPEINRGDG